MGSWPPEDVSEVEGRIVAEYKGWIRGNGKLAVEGNAAYLRVNTGLSPEFEKREAGDQLTAPRL